MRERILTVAFTAALIAVQVNSAPQHNSTILGPDSQTPVITAKQTDLAIAPAVVQLSRSRRAKTPFGKDEISKFTVKRVEGHDEEATDDDYYVIYFEPSTDTDADHHHHEENSNNFQSSGDGKKSFSIHPGVENVSSSSTDLEDQNHFFFNLPSLGSLLDFDPITQLVAGGVTSVPMIIGNIAEVFIKAISNPGKAIQDALNYAIYMHKKDPRVKMTTPELVKHNGYPCETHTTTTEDGYILEVHRIPHGKGKGKNGGEKIPVLLEHGFMQTSASWVIRKPPNSLAFMLADAGFDVWMANFRGANHYGRRHVNKKETDPSFWEWSFDEQGKYDYPAHIDLVTKVTKKPRVFVVAHSSATTAYFTMSNQRPEYRDRVKALFAMAPVARLDYMTSPILRFCALWSDKFKIFADIVGMGKFMGSDGLSLPFDVMSCTKFGWATDICKNVMFLMIGFDPEQADPEAIGLLLGGELGGTSTRTMVHYGQIHNALRFQKYDHGVFTNMLVYKTATPPEYLMSMVTTLTFAYWGQNDWLAQPEDIKWTLSQLPSLAQNYKVPIDQWNHADFIYGKDARKVVYDDILENMNTLSWG